MPSIAFPSHLRILALAGMACLSACIGHVVRDSVAASPATPDQLAARGLAGAALFPGLASLCDLDMVFRNVNLPYQSRPRGGVRGGRADGDDEAGGALRQQRAALGPMKVFDDLHFLGNGAVSAWLVGTPEHGFVLFDALNTNAEAERDIIGGMAKLGLDPALISRFIITHGHGDHYGGHRYLTGKLGLPVTMSAPDWALARTLGDHPRFGPAPITGETVTDGEIIQLGETAIRILVTSAHTPGTISPIITVHDRGRPHRVMLWGGTGLNFGPDERRLREYAASAARLRELARAEGVDVFISNHPARDGSAEKMRQLAGRAAGEPHPFVTGPDTLRVFDLLEFCPLAQAERIAAGMYPAR